MNPAGRAADDGADARMPACRDAYLDAHVEGLLRVECRGASVSLLAPRSVFSSGRIDDGTRLLLDRLPAEAPRSFLDLGCGYGALGLPIAHRHPEARGVLVDRDLLAVAFARRNAGALGLRNVRVVPSLGFSALPPDAPRFCWVLANLPARVGPGVLEHFLAGSASRLEEDGRAFVVVIAPLAEGVEGAAARRGLRAERIAASPRHVVLSVRRGAASGDPPGEPDARGEDVTVYRRDAIEVPLPGTFRDGFSGPFPDSESGGLPPTLRLHRPTDLADEPHRLVAAIPLLAERLACGLADGRGGSGGPPLGRVPPSGHPLGEDPRAVLVLRCGYGLVAALALARFPRARVVALDRDLLATAFTRYNCEGAGERLRVVEAIDPEAAAEEGPFDLILGEILPSLGPRAMARELAGARSLLAPGGRGLLIGQLRPARDLVRAEGASLGLRLEGTRLEGDRVAAGLIGFGPAPGDAGRRRGSCLP